jgi:hypothetical protein
MGLKFRRGTTAQQSGSLAFGEPYVNTTLGTLVVGGATGDIILSSTGTGSTGNFGAISGSGLDITGNAKIGGNLTLGGNITIGDNTADNVTVVASLSSSLIPSTTDIFDLGSPTKQWRDLYLSSASLYIDGTQVLSSTATELIFTTDTGQSIKFNELGTDNIILQTADGDIELKSSGGGDILLDPTAGLISVKGNVSMQDGTAKFLSSGGNSVVFGNDLVVTGSITTTGNINGLNLTTFSSSIASTLSNQNSATSSYETKGRGIVSGSSQITYASISSIPSGIVSGSSQITYASISSIPSGIVSGSSQITAGSTTNFATDVKTQLNSNTVVSGSSQVTLSSTTGGSTSSNVQFGSLGIGMAATGTSGRIDAANDIVAFSSSDIRFKENITPIENALDKISKISGNTYDWKAENKVEHGYEGNDVGVIAQEIEAVLPQLVQTRESGFKAVKYDKLVALLIEGIKEQQTQIHSLTIEIEKLKESKGL